jgi:hypothetical protein
MRKTKVLRKKKILSKNHTCCLAAPADANPMAGSEFDNIFKQLLDSHLPYFVTMSAVKEQKRLLSSGSERPGPRPGLRAPYKTAVPATLFHLVVQPLGTFAEEVWWHRSNKEQH